MQLNFVIGKEIQYSTKIPYSREQLLGPEKDNKQKFKIPISLNTITSNKKSNASNNFEDEYETSSYSSSDSFNAEDEDLEEEDKLLESIKSNEEGDKKLLRKYKYEDMTTIQNLYFNNSSNKKKKDLSEDEIARKNEQMLKRKIHAKRMLEEEKRQTIEKILNEDGRKLRERQRKLNEDSVKKEQKQEENFKISLTKIKHKYGKDGKIFVRFPQGLLIPKVLIQKPIHYPMMKHCEVMNCKNEKKYKDPITKTNYCSIPCYNILKNTKHII